MGRQHFFQVGLVFSGTLDCIRLGTVGLLCPGVIGYLRLQISARKFFVARKRRQGSSQRILVIGALTIRVVNLSVSIALGIQIRGRITFALIFRQKDILQ